VSGLELLCRAFAALGRAPGWAHLESVAFLTGAGGDSCDALRRLLALPSVGR
jgi:hypothetical protein